MLATVTRQDLPSAPRADLRYRRAAAPPAQNAALDQPGGLMPADVIGLGLRQRPGDSQTRDLDHPPAMHQTLTVVDGFVAGLNRSCRQPGLSSDNHVGKGEVSRQARDLGAGDIEGNMRRSRHRRRSWTSTDGPRTTRQVLPLTEHKHLPAFEVRGPSDAIHLLVPSFRCRGSGYSGATSSPT